MQINESLIETKGMTLHQALHKIVALKHKTGLFYAIGASYGSHYIEPF